MKDMNTVLVLGSGGREHALAWRFSQSATVKHTYVAPGNAGIMAEDNIDNVDLDVNDFDQIKSFCLKAQVDLVMVGPEQPLVNGIVDFLNDAGIACFGPSKAASQLEGSKAFAKAFLQKHQIPTADYAVFTETDEACKYLKEKTFPQVIKADGLAAGKGVIIVDNYMQGEAVIHDMLSDSKFGKAGNRIVIEEFLCGEEASFIVMADGVNCIAMASSQDHKARDDGDKGPNTGGMGAYTPAPIIDADMHQHIMSEIISPTLQAMRSEGMPFTGFLYAGLMINSGSAKVLEFNVRFGDPETQPIMMRLQSPLDQLCFAAIEGNLNQQTVQWDSRYAVGVVMVEKGYPEQYTTGHRITGLPPARIHSDACKVFHAGTNNKDDEIVTAGGRVLCVCALDHSLRKAQTKAYQGVSGIHFETAYWRTDIAEKGVRRLRE